MEKYPNVTGLVLAGGRAQRMGGNDKGLIELLGRPLASYILDALSPQVGNIIINANRNQEQYRQLGHSVIADDIEGFHGPLAGMASALRNTSSDYIASVPCDGPFLCRDYVDRLYQALGDKQIAVAHDGQRLQPVYALIHRNALDSLLDYLNAGDRKIDLWYAQFGYQPADFSDCTEIFTNINTPEDLARVSKELQETA